MPRPAFRAGAVHVRVPATSANLGPGFDALGLALTLFDDVVARVADDGLQIDVAGEGEDEVARDESHLLVRAMRAAFEHLGGQPHGLELSCANRIPHGRGLGSSAAAIVAGVVLARALVVGADQRLSDEQVLRLASGLEGHPDNVAACLYGGATVAWTEPDVHAVRLDCDPSIRPVALIAPFAMSTRTARRALPKTVPHGDAAFVAGRAALLVAALTRSPQALFAATEDRLHQPYRVPRMPATAKLLERLRGDGLPAVLSGAGPSVLVLARDEDEARRAVGHTPAGWHADELEVAASGAEIRPVVAGLESP